VPATPITSVDATAGGAAAAPAREADTKPDLSPSIAGLDSAQLDAIKSEIFSKAQFVGQLVESALRWEVEAGELRLYFPTEHRALADLLQARDNVEKLRTIASRVLGQPLRVCVKLEASSVSSGSATKVRTGESGPELRARFEQDPIVRAMLERFGGRISEVKRRDEG
jgi:hypothetical protein